MTEPVEFDEAIATQLEALYRTGDVVRRRRLVAEALAPVEGETILDVGCGPAFFITDLLDRVGSSGSLFGADTSPQMLEVARRRCAGHSNVTLIDGSAISLPFEDRSFDAAVCVQVLEYVPEIAVALRELRRVLRPGGRAVIWDVDWSTTSWYSDEPDRMARVLRAWDEHLVHPALPRTLAASLSSAGFGSVTCDGHAFVTTKSSADTYGGAAVRMVRGFAPGHGGVTEDEARAWAAEQRELDDQGRFYFACIQCCFTAVADV
jgi:ubiquinone/menaquinone biosynthesis C-methylase UbiE